MTDITFEIEKSKNWNYLLEATLKFEDGFLPAAQTVFPRQRQDVDTLVQHLQENTADLKKDAADINALDDVKKEKILRGFIENMVAFRATDCEAAFSTQHEMMIMRFAEQSRNTITELMTRGVKDSDEYFETRNKAQAYTTMISIAVEDSARGRKPRQTVPLF